MSKKNWEPELSLGTTPEVRNQTSDRLQRHQLDTLITNELIAYHVQRYEQLHGFTTPRTAIRLRVRDRAARLLDHLVKEFFAPHDAQWNELPEFSGPEDYRDLVEARTRIARDWIDWIVANHFRGLGLHDVASEYWMARYCESLAKDRARQAGVGDWQKKALAADITESWD